MIKLDDGYFINATESQYILVRRKKNPTPKQQFDIIGYYSTVASALEGCAKYIMRQKVLSDDMSLSEAISSLKNIESELKRMIPDGM